MRQYLEEEFSSKLTTRATTYIIIGMKKKFYSTLCNNHNQIMYNLGEIKKLTKDAKIRTLINETLEYSRYCKKQGQHLENRARNYRRAIEGLGFQRVRKEKKEWD